MSYEAKLKELGFPLPIVELDAGKLVHAVRTGDLVYTSGQVSRWDGRDLKGVVGDDLTVEEAYEGARMSGLGCLAAIHSLVGIDAVTRIVKVLGMVNTRPGFPDTPAVIHGCSDLLLSVFGDAGKHARSAVGVVLPLGYATEVEMIVEVS